MNELVLASASVSRQRMLTAAGVKFRISAADLNETALIADLRSNGTNAEGIAAALAAQKAVMVSRRSPGALVLGGDSVLSFGSEIVSKCRDLAELGTLLRKLSGQTHDLISAASLARDGAEVWRHTGTARLTMRPLGEDFLDTYLAEEGEALLSSVGGYRFEGRGSQLFAQVEGDFFTILGLPLLAVLAALRAEGILPHDPAYSMTIRAGIVGWPVSHSLSPILHAYWLKEHGIDGEYARLPAQPDEFAARVERAQQQGFSGLNVTVPHKEAAFRLAEIRDPAAEICGAVNLLVFGRGPVQGRNTDHVGLYKSLEENLGKDALKGKTVLMLGAGGAARAAILALAELGVAQIDILNRSPVRAESLSRDMALKTKPRLVPGPLTAFASLAQGAALLVNTSSAGMTGNDPLALDLSPLPLTASVCDIVYSPLQTMLLKDAAKRGHKTIDGLGMLMHQAVPSFEAFFGVAPKVTPGLRAALERALHAG